MDIIQAIQDTYKSANGLSRKAVYEQLKPKYGKAITHKLVRETLNNTEGYQQTRYPAEQSLYPIFDTRDDSYQIDLTFLQRPQHSKIGFLVCIEVTSRKAYVYPIKNKTATVIAETLNKFINESHAKYLSSDNGPEFINSKVAKVLKMHNVALTVGDPDNKKRMAIVERFNRTLKHRILVFQRANESALFMHELMKIIDGYNNRKHSSLNGYSPNEVHSDYGQKFLIRHAAWRKYEAMKHKTESQFNIGDNVRMRLPKNSPFAKEGQTYSNKVYTISAQDGLRFILSDGNKTLRRGYFARELLPTPAEAISNTAVDLEQRDNDIRRQKRIRAALQREGINQSNERSRMRTRGIVGGKH